MKKIRRKEVIYRAGDRAEALYQLERGLVRITEILPDGRQLTLRHVLPGEFFGEEALSRKHYRYTAEALTEASIEATDPLHLAHEELARIASSLARQMAQVQAYETHLQWGELRSRICRYLLYLSRTASRGQDAKGIYVTASHEEIADATASTRESVSKLLSDLRHEGILDTGYRKIYLMDPKALEREAEIFVLEAV
jgi:CRP-like cAMP-binding protein